VLFHYRSRPDSFSRKHVPHQWLMKMYRDILLRHLPLYRKEIVAYNDGVREEISCMGHVREQLESLLQEAQEARFTLSEDNRWMRLSRQIPWAKLEERFGHCFSRWKGRFAAPVRVALGLYLIQAETGLSDVMLLRELPENPYMQYFCHLMGPEISLEEADMAYVHEQLTPRVLEEINGTLGE